uniref:E3 ubiquitin-protein ligase listerin n=1 Tax=Heterorhabditis bacteriophora TaxID=37862 RepID=A0A1I7WPE7_HETBA
MDSSTTTDCFSAFNTFLKASYEIIVDEQITKTERKCQGTIKSALLGLSLKLSDFIPVLLESPLSAWIISNLDSSENTICKGAFEAFVHLGRDDRKKQSYWHEASPYLLPSFSLIITHIDKKDRARFVLSFLQSFTDYLPFDTSNLMENWITAFSECLKYALSHDCDLSEDDMKFCSRQLIEVFDIISGESHAVQYVAVDLFMWILDKNIFSETKITELLDVLQLNLMNKHTKCVPVLARLLSSCNWRLRRLHVAVCHVYPLDVDLISPLLISSDDYLNYIDKELDLVFYLSKCSELEARVFARVILRLLKINKEKAQTIKLDSSPFTRSLLSECSDEDWLYLQPSLVENRIPILSKIVLDWMLEQNSLLAINLLNRLELPVDLTVSISDLLLKCLFNICLDKDDLSILTTLSRFPPSNLLIRTILSSSIQQKSCSSELQTQGKPSAENLGNIGSICSTLLRSNRDFSELLLTANELETILVEYDNYVSRLFEQIFIFQYQCIIEVCSDLVFKYALITESFAEEVDYSTMKTTGSSQEALLELIESTARRALVYLSIDNEESFLDCSIALSIVHLFMTEFLINSRLAFVPPSEIVIASLDKCREMLQLQHFSSRVVSGLLSVPLITVSGLFTLRRLKELEKPDIPISSWISCERGVSVFWAIQADCTKLSMDTVDEWISRQLKEHAEVKGSEWDGLIFNVRSFSRLPMVGRSSSWLISSQDLTKATLRKSKFLSDILLSLFFKIDHIANCIGFRSSELDSQISLLQTSANCCWHNLTVILAPRSGAQSCLNVQLCDLKCFKAQGTTIFKRISFRYYLALIFTFFPTNTVHVEEVAYRKFDEILKNFEQHSYIGIRNCYVVYASLIALKICSRIIRVPCILYNKVNNIFCLCRISPTMYHQENGQWIEDDKVSSSGPRRLAVPFTLSRIANETKGWPAIMALDAAIVPLMNTIFFDDERVAYCDALSSIIQTVLPQLISRCPSTIQHSNVILYVLYVYYASKPFRTMRTVPAVIRTWYNGLPNTGAQFVNKYVKCRQCKNKFHSNCLYKWFESSSQSRCPLCRANFT